MNKSFEIINLACYFNDKSFEETNIKRVGGGGNGGFYGDIYDMESFSN